jgi:hypothetical protein
VDENDFTTLSPRGIELVMALEDSGEDCVPSFDVDCESEGVQDFEEFIAPCCAELTHDSTDWSLGTIPSCT